MTQVTDEDDSDSDEKIDFKAEDFDEKGNYIIKKKLKWVRRYNKKDYKIGIAEIIDLDRDSDQDGENSKNNSKRKSQFDPDLDDTQDIDCEDEIDKMMSDMYGKAEMEYKSKKTLEREERNKKEAILKKNKKAISKAVFNQNAPAAKKVKLSDEDDLQMKISSGMSFTEARRAQQREKEEETKLERQEEIRREKLRARALIEEEIGTGIGGLDESFSRLDCTIDEDDSPRITGGTSNTTNNQRSNRNNRNNTRRQQPNPIPEDDEFNFDQDIRNYANEKQITIGNIFFGTEQKSITIEDIDNLRNNFYLNLLRQIIKKQVKNCMDQQLSVEHLVANYRLMRNGENVDFSKDFRSCRELRMIKKKSKDIKLNIDENNFEIEEEPLRPNFDRFKVRKITKFDRQKFVERMDALEENEPIFDESQNNNDANYNNGQNGGGKESQKSNYITLIIQCSATKKEEIQFPSIEISELKVIDIKNKLKDLDAEYFGPLFAVKTTKRIGTEYTTTEKVLSAHESCELWYREDVYGNHFRMPSNRGSTEYQRQFRTWQMETGGECVRRNLNTKETKGVTTEEKWKYVLNFEGDDLNDNESLGEDGLDLEGGEVIDLKKKIIESKTINKPPTKKPGPSRQAIRAVPLPGSQRNQQTRASQRSQAPQTASRPAQAPVPMPPLPTLS